MKQKSENNREIQKPYHKGTIVLIQIALEKLANQCFSVPIAGKHITVIMKFLRCTQAISSISMISTGC